MQVGRAAAGSSAAEELLHNASMKWSVAGFNERLDFALPDGRPSPHWRLWLGVENHSVAPFTSFSKNEVLSNGRIRRSGTEGGGSAAAERAEAWEAKGYTLIHGLIDLIQ
jgi:hypothetical protein